MDGPAIGSMARKAYCDMGEHKKCIRNVTTKVTRTVVWSEYSIVQCVITAGWLIRGFMKDQVSYWVQGLGEYSGSVKLQVKDKGIREDGLWQ